MVLLLLHAPHHVLCVALNRKDVDVRVCHVFNEDVLQVLIVSYETFRLHAEKFRGEGACDLLICDEAHRLKNDQTLTNKARRSSAQECVLTYVTLEQQGSEGLWCEAFLVLQ